MTPPTHCALYFFSSRCVCKCSYLCCRTRWDFGLGLEFGTLLFDRGASLILWSKTSAFRREYSYLPLRANYTSIHWLDKRCQDYHTRSLNQTKEAFSGLRSSVDGCQVFSWCSDLAQEFWLAHLLCLWGSVNSCERFSNSEVWRLHKFGTWRGWDTSRSLSALSSLQLCFMRCWSVFFAPLTASYLVPW